MLLACGRCGKPNDFPIGGALMGFSCGEGARLAQSPELSSGSCTSVDRPRDSQVFTGDLLKFGRPGGGPGSGPGRATPERPGGEGELASFTSSFSSDTVLSSAAAADATAFSIWCSSGAVADATAPSILGSSVAAADATALSFLSGSSPSMSSAAAAAADASACGALRDAESDLSWTISPIVSAISFVSSSRAE